MGNYKMGNGKVDRHRLHCAFPQLLHSVCLHGRSSLPVTSNCTRRLIANTFVSLALRV